MTVEELRQQLQATYTTIREVDEDLAAGRLSAADHADLKQRSERQAAVLLKRLREAEGVGAVTGAPAGAARPPVALGGRLRSPLGVAAGAVALVVVSFGAGVLLARSTASEAPVAPVPASAEQVPGAAVSPELEALRKAAEPQDAPTDRVLAFAHRALDEGQLPAAIAGYRRVLAREPDNVEAITRIAVILYQGGHVAEALGRLERALRIDPRHAGALWERARILYTGQKGSPDTVRALEAFLAVTPAGDTATEARAMLAEARRLAPPSR